MEVDGVATPGPTFSHLFCKNTVPKPVYYIWLHNFDGEIKAKSGTAKKGDFSGFIFDPAGAGILCNEISLNDGGKTIDRNKCTKTGVRSIRKSYKSRKTVVNTMRISIVNRSRYQNLYESKKLFSYPENIKDIPIEQCFVYMDKNLKVTIGYDEANYADLSYCLIAFENFLKKNKSIMLSLME